MQTKINKLVNNFLDKLGAKAEVNVSEFNSQYQIDISGDNLNFLIGFRGESLNALQHFISLSLFTAHSEWVEINLDINGYKLKKREKLEEMAKNFIDRVRFFNTEVGMPPMSSYERKFIHEFVSEYSDIESISEGEGLDRHIVLKPKNS